MTAFEDVKEFHTDFDLLINKIPTLPDKDTIKLRWELIEEEMAELRDELIDAYYLDIPEERQKLLLTKVAKEAADLIYVLNGMAVSFGIDMDKVFAEVHRSNMTKKTKDGKILRREDGKVIKPDTYEPANIEGVLYGNN